MCTDRHTCIFQHACMHMGCMDGLAEEAQAMTLEQHRPPQQNADACMVQVVTNAYAHVLLCVTNSLVSWLALTALSKLHAHASAPRIVTNTA
jgi:hypothetical protein